LLLEPAQHPPVDEERPGELERNRASLVLLKRSSKRVGGLFRPAPRVEQKPAAPRADGKAPGDMRPRGARFKGGEQALGVLELADRPRRLRRVGADAADGQP